MEKLGVLSTAQEVFEYTICNSNGMSLSAINYGGIITKILVPDVDGNLHNVVLSYPTLEGYVHDSFYIGALIGRCANRISNASFQILGKQYKVTKNQGENHLHGGAGFHTAYWNITKKQTELGESLELQLTSADGADGYPGNMNVLVEYILTNENEVIINYSAQTDAPTIANFTQHTYFNLSGSTESNILNHELELFADSFLPVNAFGIPTGKVQSISELCNAKSTVQTIVESNVPQIAIANGLDHCFVVSDSNTNGLQKIAKLFSPTTNIELTVFTNTEAFQCYSGNFLEGNFKKHAGICIETQAYTNAINEPSFPSVVLLPNSEYNKKTVFKF